MAVRLLDRVPNEELIRSCIERLQPAAFGWLESALGDRVSVADLAIASPFVNLRHAGAELDAGALAETRALPPGDLEAVVVRGPAEGRVRFVTSGVTERAGRPTDPASPGQ
ncbi:MAG: hypothetical protein U0587_05145 [Candidatus Binatia bacterium]